MSERVVVTGMGAVTPLGLDAPSTWKAMIEARSGVAPITAFDASSFPVRIAAEIKGFNPSDYLPAKLVKRTDRFTQLALVATLEALRDAGLTITPGIADEVGVLVGSGIGGIITLSEQMEVMRLKGPDRVSPFLVPMMLADMAAGQVAITTGARGTNFCIASACATSGHGVGEAAEIIARGDARVMIAGGTETGVVPIALAGFAAIRALSTRNDEPERASRPFDAQRDGFVVAEGAGIMVLEALSHATQRSARIYAELVGYGSTDDAYHISAPSEGGEGAARAMRMALRKAGLEPGQIDYINAHGTSTPYNDKMETMAIKQVFGQFAHDIPVSSTKSMTGHLLGSAGVIEAIVCVNTINEGIIPPTINYEYPDPDCDLDYVPNVARRHRVDYALSNSLGFGGHNTTLIFGRFKE